MGRWVSWDDAIGSSWATGIPAEEVDPAQLGADAALEFSKRLSFGDLPGDQNWRRQARCHGQTDLFYPRWSKEDDLQHATGGATSSLKVESARPERHAAARALCDSCPVFFDCLGWAMRVAGIEKDVLLAGTAWNLRKKLLAALRWAIEHGDATIPRKVPIYDVDPDTGRRTPVYVLGDDGRPLVDAKGRKVQATERRRIALSEARLGDVGEPRMTWAIFATPWRTGAGRVVHIATVYETLADWPQTVANAYRAEAERRGHTPTRADADLIVRSMRLRPVTPRG